MTSPLPSDDAPAWHVLGAGAMGCLWAAHLWQHEPLTRRVALLLRSAADVEALERRGGITLENAWESGVLERPGPRTMQIEIDAQPSESDSFRGNPISHLLVATKAQDVAEALHNVQSRLTPQTRIVLLQNGVKVQRETTAQYGAERVFCLSTSHGAWRREPFHVVHAGMGTAWLGQLDKADDDALSSLLHALPAASLQISTDVQIARRLWQKFAVNCAVNALTVVHDCRNGELLVMPAARQALLALVEEIAFVLARLPEVPPLPDLQASVMEVLQATAYNLSSTLQDARLGRPTELSHLNGYLGELARQHGLASPLNDYILQRAEASAAARLA